MVSLKFFQLRKVLASPDFKQDPISASEASAAAEAAEAAETAVVPILSPVYLFKTSQFQGKTESSRKSGVRVATSSRNLFVPLGC